jgi:hypothetical protein
MKRKVIPLSNLQVKPPLLGLGVIYMAMDLYKAPSWSWGVYATISFILVLNWLYRAFTDDQVDVQGYSDPKQNIVNIQVGK